MAKSSRTAGNSKDSCQRIIQAGRVFGTQRWRGARSLVFELALMRGG
jgi:hypothetical protein